jgi:MoxR-like ATPase
VADLAQPFTLLIRGLLSIGGDEVRYRLRKRTSPPLPEVDEDGHLIDGDSTFGPFSDLVIEGSSGEFPDLPELDAETRIGDSFRDEDEDEAVDVFAGIIGLESEKRVLRALVNSPRTVGTHALLIGPPGSSKSEVLRALGQMDDSVYVGARGMRGPGLRSMFLRPETGRKPVILRIDEFDKLEPAMVAPLLELCDGHVSEVISGSQRDEQVHVHVIAAANDIKPIERLPSGNALLNRFHKLYLPDLSLEERRAVIRAAIAKREGMSDEDAAAIADLVAPHTSDVRTAEQIAELWSADPDLARERAAALGTAGA